MRTLIINNKNDNKKLNTVLLNEFSGLSMNTLYKALRKKDIRINNIRISQNVVVHLGDEIKIFIPDEVLFNSSNKGLDLKFDKDLILYEDDNIIAINKPSGIEVTGTNSLTDLVSNFLGYNVFPCHRLDRNTSGVILFAKDEDSLNILFGKFKNHEIEKHYTCEVYGIPAERHRILTDFLFKDNKKSMVYISNIPKKGYVKIITEYTVISSNAKTNTSKLDIQLHTGKTHQIRAHLAYYGHPILGDGKYGINEINKKFKLKTQVLSSYSLQFKFITPSEKLDYLNNVIIHI